MEKITYSGDNDELVQACGGSVASYLDGHHTKAAGSSVFSRDLIRANCPDDAHFGVHLIAMGADENYGANKNGDGWPRAGLMNKSGNYGAHTFVSNGHYFLEHNNRNPKLARGVIKAAGYNPEMDRVELIIWGDKRKAEEDYQLAKQGKTLTFSMSARVPFDRCSVCDHVAKSSAVYCSHLKHQMGQYVPQFAKFAYAINDYPNFFDISRVRNPADRIAHWLEYIMPGDGLAKAASVPNEFLFSDQQAGLLGVSLPESHELGHSEPEGRKWLMKLAALEDYWEALLTNPSGVAHDERFNFAKHAAAYAFDEHAVTDAELEAFRRMETDVLFGHLVKRASMLPFLAFYAYVNKLSIKEAASSPEYQEARAALPGMFRRALEQPADVTLEQLLRPAVTEKLAACHTEDPIDQIMDRVSEKTTVEPERVRVRIMRICASRPESETLPCGCKLASELSPDVQNITRAYALYKTATVAALSGQMSVDDSTLLLLTYPA